MSADDQCQGKQRFARYDIADEVARNQAHRHPGERFQIYLCKYCGHFHIGTALKTNRRSVAVATREEWDELDHIEMMLNSKGNNT